MNKKEIYRLRDILHEMKHIKEADTNPKATHDQFLKIYEEGIMLCNRSINMRKPLEEE